MDAFLAMPARRPRRRKTPATSAVPTTLTLIAAAFDDAAETLSMTFDRAISIGAYDGGATRVNVPTLGSLYVADVHVTLSPDGRTLVAEGEVVESAEGSTAWLSVPANSGIVDAATGAAWVGCSEVALPFGEG